MRASYQEVAERLMEHKHVELTRGGAIKLLEEFGFKDKTKTLHAEEGYSSKWIVDTRTIFRHHDLADSEAVSLPRSADILPLTILQEMSTGLSKLKEVRPDLFDKPMLRAPVDRWRDEVTTPTRRAVAGFVID